MLFRSREGVPPRCREKEFAKAPLQCSLYFMVRDITKTALRYHQNGGALFVKLTWRNKILGNRGGLWLGFGMTERWWSCWGVFGLIGCFEPVRLALEVAIRLAPGRGGRAGPGKGIGIASRPSEVSAA